MSHPPNLRPSGRHVHWRRLWSLLVALAVGLILFWFGWVVLGADSQGDPGDAITTGTVVTVTGAGDGAGCRATARFDVGGVTYTAVTGTPTAASAACPYRVGDTLPIAYNPLDPADAMLLEAGPITWWRWGALLLGCVLVLYGAVGLVRATVLRVRDGRDARDEDAPEPPAEPAPDATEQDQRPG